MIRKLIFIPLASVGLVIFAISTIKLVNNHILYTQSGDKSLKVPMQIAKNNVEQNKEDRKAYKNEYTNVTNKIHTSNKKLIIKPKVETYKISNNEIKNDQVLLKENLNSDDNVTNIETNNVVTENNMNSVNSNPVNTVRKLQNQSIHFQKPISNDMTITADTYIQGGATGNITVKSGCKLIIQSRVIGDITLENNAELIIQSLLVGDIYNNGGHIKNFGNHKGKIRQ